MQESSGLDHNRGKAPAKAAITTRTRWVSGQLSSAECIWRDRQPWLEERGYTLRPRYRPDWIPSWKGTDIWSLMCEDGQILIHHNVLDATRISDGTVVMLKSIDSSIHPHEVEIAKTLCSEPLKSDTRNHCVPTIEVLQDPKEEAVSIIVMPFLQTYNEPRFQTIGEAVEFFRQALEGLQFMHENRIAHSDISPFNIRLGPLPLYGPTLAHPSDARKTRDYRKWATPYTRTERPTKYYYVDFGLSRRYNPNDEPPLELPVLGGDKSVPERQGNGHVKLGDPFAADVYYLGSCILLEFLVKYSGLRFMYELVAGMTMSDPQERLTIDQAVRRFAAVESELPRWQCRQRLVSRKEKETLLQRGFRGFGHLLRTTSYVLRGLPAVPTPAPLR
ncbi:uncharacterized protein C8Q71DRAFT_748236 [Rhodofomes roseus]|uniref:Protein kinase domain-containing protein n=1 Tax=Rhodofomes roseus TaxID=34475 RepID=A0ABQ8KLG0_9APHY|nr:uncharacterized protein C8Q71DRAFT_748236 [Rhodofomes roseus]KAH9839162.1 hypothetical protein C8Q71DRAFT_748236 [Rhodofomes roseus]